MGRVNFILVLTPGGRWLAPVVPPVTWLGSEGCGCSFAGRTSPCTWLLRSAGGSAAAAACAGLNLILSLLPSFRLPAAVPGAGSAPGTQHDATHMRQKFTRGRWSVRRVKAGHGYKGWHILVLSTTPAAAVWDSRPIHASCQLLCCCFVADHRLQAGFQPLQACLRGIQPVMPCVGACKPEKLIVMLPQVRTTCCHPWAGG